jgi:dTMP kinase
LAYAEANKFGDDPNMFITFEGIEGCGKTTQMERFAENLKEHGIPLITTFEPGGNSYR